MHAGSAHVAAQSAPRSGTAWRDNRRHRHRAQPPCPTSCRARSAPGPAYPCLPCASDRARSAHQPRAGRDRAPPHRNSRSSPDNGRPRHRWRGQSHSRPLRGWHATGGPDWAHPRRSERAFESSPFCVVSFRTKLARVRNEYVAYSSRFNRASGRRSLRSGHRHRPRRPIRRA